MPVLPGPPGAELCPGASGSGAHEGLRQMAGAVSALGVFQKTQSKSQ